ncbi:MAG: hypothetical protein AB3N19_05705, partial [Ruegeria sp.]
MQFTDIVLSQSISVQTNSKKFAFDEVAAVVAELEARLQEFADRTSSKLSGKSRMQLSVEARYSAQVWELEVPLAAGVPKTPDDVAALVEAFHGVHERVYSVADR